MRRASVNGTCPIRKLLIWSSESVSKACMMLSVGEGWCRANPVSTFGTKITWGREGEAKRVAGEMMTGQEEEGGGGMRRKEEARGIEEEEVTRRKEGVMRKNDQQRKGQ